MADRELTPHQLLDLITYQLVRLRKATPQQLAAVHEDLAEAEALIGPAAEHVEQEAEHQHETQRQHREKTAEQTRLKFLPSARNVA